MTGIQINRDRSIRFRTVFAAAVVLSLAIAVFAGIKLETAENCIILPKSPFRELPFWEAVIKICFWDIAAFWLLSIPLTKTLTIIVSSVLFFFRGMIIGNGCRTFFENSVPAVAICVLVSYAAITLLLLIYDSFLNARGERSALTRLLSCLIATGAAAIVRILPMLLFD